MYAYSSDSHVHLHFEVIDMYAYTARWLTCTLTLQWHVRLHCSDMYACTERYKFDAFACRLNVLVQRFYQ